MGKVDFDLLETLLIFVSILVNMVFYEEVFSVRSAFR